MVVLGGLQGVGQFGGDVVGFLGFFLLVGLDAHVELFVVHFGFGVGGFVAVEGLLGGLLGRVCFYLFMFRRVGQCEISVVVVGEFLVCCYGGCLLYLFVMSGFVFWYWFECFYGLGRLRFGNLLVEVFGALIGGVGEVGEVAVLGGVVDGGDLVGVVLVGWMEVDGFADAMV